MDAPCREIYHFRACGEYAGAQSALPHNQQVQHQAYAHTEHHAQAHHAPAALMLAGAVVLADEGHG